MIELLLPWVLVALPVPLFMYLLPAKNQNQAAALRMPILIQ
jgi:Ca-activated chloride channel family protein